MTGQKNPTLVHITSGSQNKLSYPSGKSIKPLESIDFKLSIELIFGSFLFEN